jgi:hypothetical protein
MKDIVFVAIRWHFLQLPLATYDSAIAFVEVKCL